MLPAVNSLLEPALFTSYLLAGPASWSLYALGMRTGLRRMNLLGRGKSLPPTLPTILAVIPARNEEGNIEACVRSVLAQQNIPLSVLVIDDVSEDRTGQILDALAATEPRVHVIHLPKGEIPKGWTGKCWALHRGLNAFTAANASSGGGDDFLLFVDSDVTMEPTALPRALELALAGRDGDDRKGHALVSLLFRQEMVGESQLALVPLCAAAVVGMFGVAYANNDHFKRHAFACGQFLLIRRKMYDQVGGHSRLTGVAAEDVELARLVKAAGGRPRVAEAGTLGCVRQHAGTLGAIRQWSRNLYVNPYGRPWTLLGGLAFIAFSILSILPAWIWTIHRLRDLLTNGPNAAHSAYFSAPTETAAWSAAVVIHAILMTLMLSQTYKAQGQSRIAVWRAPLGIALLTLTIAEALWYCLSKRVVWRGRAVSA